MAAPHVREEGAQLVSASGPALSVPEEPEQLARDEKPLLQSPLEELTDLSVQNPALTLSLPLGKSQLRRRFAGSR
jgi:hypothetical protein